MTAQYFRVKYVFSKDVPEIISKIMEKEFMDLRETAVNLLNPRYEEWNNAYTGEDGDEYMRYISAKQREVLAEVNKSRKTIMTELDCDEECDIIARNTYFPSITMTMELIPV